MQGTTNTSHSSSLAQVVCDWQPSALPELAKAFSDSCSPPEITFSSYDSYKSYFEPLLLAEVAAEFLSAYEKFHRTPPARHTKIRARREEVGTNAAPVAVQRVSRHHPYGFGWTVDLDSHDRKGPVGSVDNDVVAVWPCHPSQVQSKKGPDRGNVAPAPRKIPKEAVFAVVSRTIGRNGYGCRLLLSKFPDGNELGVRIDLEEGEENEDEAPHLRLWNCLRLGSLTTMKREYEAVHKIRTSLLLPILLRPKSATSGSAALEKLESGPMPNLSSKETGVSSTQDRSDRPPLQKLRIRNEETFTNVVATKTGLNPSQARAIMHASTCRNGFSIIQGPPGTGKTRTLISMLNVIHMTQYQEYYESLLSSFEPILQRGTRDAVKTSAGSGDPRNATLPKAGQGSLLQGMMIAMNKTLSTAPTEQKQTSTGKRVNRPRLLVCAPSNSAVDEILTRLTKCKFVDGQGREYCPELARIGAGDKVSEAAKPFTAEGQAETFLDRLCAEDMKPEVQKKVQMTFLNSWQNRCNALLVQLERIPKKQSSSRPAIIDLHEKLERMDRDLRRLSIAASDGSKALTREEKLRQIARTYVEDAQLVFATLSGSASSILTKKGSNDMTSADGALFDTVVIDEGAQATEPSCLIPMALGATRCLLVGDPQQLPATVLSSGAAGLAYGQSLLERVCRAGQGVQLLDTQYRMHPAISSFPRRYFYNGRLVDDESVQGDHRARPYHRDEVRPKLGPYVFLDISEGQEQRGKADRSIFNRAEAELASLIYSKLKKEYSSDSLFSPAAKLPGSVTGFGVVTPYKRQMQELRQSFDRAGVPTGDVEIDTVDSFQGREKDVIVFSCVRTAAENRGIGFVRDVRRMNVGLTRARSSLIILGSAQALAEGSSDWAELVEDATSRGCLISVSNVQRCLKPAPQAALPADAARNRVDSQKAIKDGREEGSSSVFAPTARKSQSSSRADPRRRAIKRESEADSLQLAVKLRSNRAVPLSEAMQVLSDPHFSRKTEEKPQVLQAMHENAGAVHSTSNAKTENVSDEKPPLLQATLEQVTKILSEGGFQNRRGAEEVLKEHLRGGGGLDLETVIAAAFTANTATPQQPSDDAEALSHQKPPVPDFNSAALQNTTADNSQGVPEKVEPQKMAGKVDIAGEIAGSSDITQNGHGNATDRSSNARSASVHERGSKLKGKERTPGKQREKEHSKEPSGWNMLFANKKDATNLDKAGNVKKEVNIDHKMSDAVSKPAMDEGSQSEVGTVKREKKAAGTENPEVTAEASTPSPDGKDGSKPERDAPARDSNKFKGSRGDTNRGFERKRPRGNDYNSGRGGMRNERGRNRGKRGRGRGGSYHEQNNHNRYNNEVWNQGQYDSAYAQYANAMAGNGFEQGMNPGTHDMNSLQAMQQQAIQQQLMQQSVFQQPAYHPAYQAIQQQMLQQEALRQQEAYRQQQVLMQMSAAGVPTHVYPGTGFDSANNNVNPSNLRTGSWSGNSGRGGRGGRGRGRMKYSGRGR